MKFLCVIETDDRFFYFKKALLRLQEEFDWVEGACFSPYEVRQDDLLHHELLEEAKTCDMAIVYFHTSCQNLPDFHGFWQTIPEKTKRFFVASLPEEIQEFAKSSSLSAEEYQMLNSYFSRPTEENIYRMLRAVLHAYFGLEGQPLPYVDVPDYGLYLKGRVLSEEETEKYLNSIPEDTPVIGVVVQRHYVLTGNLKATNRLIEALEEEGCFVIPAFTSPNGNQDFYPLDLYFKRKEETLVDAIVVLTGFSLTALSTGKKGLETIKYSIFEKWDVPVLQALSTRYNLEEYEEMPQGLDSISLMSNVFQPEIDGQIITVPTASSNAIHECDMERKLWFPIEDRVEYLVSLAKNFAALSRQRKNNKNAEKKVAIIFHNLPGNHNIGRGLGLDTFASVYHLLHAMQERGYTMDHLYHTPQEIADTVIEGLTNDWRWMSAEDMYQRSADKMDVNVVNGWFDTLSQKVREDLLESWGKPPGELLVEGGSMLIPGVLNGNIFIGLQPSRAFDQKADEIYHSAVFPPPYSYLAYYHWIETVFKADAIIHVGTHGSLEWLPGKEVGLSKDCYPNISIGRIPHYYMYHMGVVGEGIQAKRRSNAVILEHLPAPMDDSGSYNELTELNVVLEEYYQAKERKSKQTTLIERRILDLCKKTNFLEDVKLTEEAFLENPHQAIETIHLWLEEIKNSVVTDGLHEFGQPPKDGLLTNFMRMLVRIKNGEMISLNDGVLIAMGYDPEDFRNLGNMVEGKPASVIYDKAVAHAKNLVETFYAHGFDMEALDWDFVRGDVLPLRKVLGFIRDEVYPKVMDTRLEMENLLDGLEGRFVEPGLGGNPTRGNVAILPSGRNFYALDPTMIPSRSAYEVGTNLANSSIDYYLKERGTYPESIAMIIWSGNVIKSSGEDFGEIFALMGVRPKYLNETSKVIGLEAIPLEELGRPRIDVTLRISGLFRDMYPNIIDLVDDAVHLVCNLDESHEDNFVKKHFEEDIAHFLSEDIEEDQAIDRAYMRIFGCPVGGYGAGVSNLIENKNWKDYKDISAVYETWSSHGYSRNHHGTSMKNVFTRRLQTVSMTIKNETTIEYDMLSSDDYYSYHGGLIATVKNHSKETPISLTGHTDNPDRPVVRDTKEETTRIMRSRIFNPKWLEGLKRHGFKGAQEITKAVDSFFGWDATADVASDWMYEDIAKEFLFDQETREWIASVNPGVLHDVSGKLLEADKRGMWKAKQETKKELESIYLKAEGLLEG